MRSMFVFLIGIGASMLVPDPGDAQDKKYEMTPVKYAGLKAEILKHRGKVVVVDFWAGY